jgi:enoyl-CoA hydratase/carnithine racemase
VRLTRAPVASIALIRGRATGNGSELTLACDMSFASREKAIFSQWEVGVGMVAGGGTMARLPQVMGRNRAFSDGIGSESPNNPQSHCRLVATSRGLLKVFAVTAYLSRGLR